ncbi:MAG: polysaccharide lyase 6 family protein [Bythopirellula sp.]
MSNFLFIAAVACSIGLTPTDSAGASESFVVDTLDALRIAMKAAKPGAVIEVADGSYDLQRDLEFKRLQGTLNAPITIRAKNRLQATITGDHVVKVRDSEHFVLEGFRFRMRADVYGKNGALRLRCSHHCRIAHNDFELDERNTDDKNQTWLTVDGHGSGYNRIDHNRFANKSKKGHFLFITGEDQYVSQHDLIERNHFVDRAYGNDANEYETIRVGESRVGNQSGKSYTIIRENLFQRCQGEDELVSCKVGGCSFSCNTVVDCHGSVVFRNGNDSVYSGNMILNKYHSRPFDAYRAGGIRFYGAGHRVFNNYFEGLNGTSMKAPLALMHGAPAGSGALGVADGLPATDCEVVHNTWVRCAQLRLGISSEKRPLKPKQCVFANNIVCETDDKRLLNIHEGEGITFGGNILYATRGKDTGIEEAAYTSEEFLITDPKLELRGETFRLSPDSPAVSAATFAFAYVDEDIDGAPRGNKRDIGADEYSTETINRPLSPTEVGPLQSKQSR